jgi:hypothetical protein
MSVPNRTKPKRNEAIIVNDDPEAPSLLNPINGEIYVTNKVGKRIFELADGETSTNGIVERILHQYKGTPAETVRRDVETFLTNGAERGLIEWA